MNNNDFSISKQQAVEFAYVISTDIKKYLEEHQAEYIAWCEKQKENAA